MTRFRKRKLAVSGGTSFFLVASFSLGYLALLMLPAAFLGLFLGATAAKLVFFVGLLLAAYSSFDSMEITEGALLLHRLLGPPLRLAWEEIVDIHSLDHREALRRGWFLPFYARLFERGSHSGTGLIMIVTQDDYFYFPPADPEKVEELVIAHLPNLEVVHESRQLEEMGEKKKG